MRLCEAKGGRKERTMEDDLARGVLMDEACGIQMWFTTCEGESTWGWLSSTVRKE
jgi:hypothetical protein